MLISDKSHLLLDLMKSNLPSCYVMAAFKWVSELFSLYVRKRWTTWMLSNSFIVCLGPSIKCWKCHLGVANCTLRATILATNKTSNYTGTVGLQGEVTVLWDGVLWWNAGRFSPSLFVSSLIQPIKWRGAIWFQDGEVFQSVPAVMVVFSHS